MIVDTEKDKKFTDWLEINLNGFVKPRYLKRNKPNEAIFNQPRIENNTEEKVITKEKENVKVRRLLPNNSGFSSIGFIALLVVGLLILGYIFLH